MSFTTYEEEEFLYRTYPVCPHCKHEHYDVWEWDFGYGSEGDITVECESCEKPFFVSRQCDITYTTAKLKEST
jgi:hypothetical protein